MTTDEEIIKRARTNCEGSAVAVRNILLSGSSGIESTSYSRECFANKLRSAVPGNFGYLWIGQVDNPNLGHAFVLRKGVAPNEWTIFQSCEDRYELKAHPVNIDWVTQMLQGASKDACCYKHVADTSLCPCHLTWKIAGFENVNVGIHYEPVLLSFYEAPKPWPNSLLTWWTPLAFTVGFIVYSIGYAIHSRINRE